MNIFEKNRIWRLEYFLWSLLTLPIFLFVSLCIFAWIFAFLWLIFWLDSEKIFFDVLKELFFWIDFLNYFSFKSFFIIVLSLFIFSYYFQFLITIKRLHDINLSWWFSVIFIFFGATFILFFIPWDDEENKYWKKIEKYAKKRFDNMIWIKKTF